MQNRNFARDTTVDFAPPAFPDQAQRKMIEFASRLNRALE
jgi:hypothetical protein